MRRIIMSIVLFTVIAVLLSIGLPNILIESTVSADGDVKQSTIGGIEIGNLTGEDLKNTIVQAVNDWYAQPITVSGGGSSLQISADNFQFDIDSTVKNYESHYEKPWFAFWSKEQVVHLPLEVQPSDIVKNEIRNVSYWNAEATYDQVHMHAAYLKTDDIEAEVEDLTVLENERISLSVGEIPEMAVGVHELISALNEKIIHPHVPFSFIEELGDSMNRANEEAINFVASHLYNAALQMNGEILERHAQKDVPTYLKPGLEANINSFTSEDLKFANTSTNPMLLKISIDGTKLQTEIYTSFKDVEVSVRVSRDEEIQARTIIRYSEELAIGKTEQLQAGITGLRVSVYRTVSGVEQLMSRDYYPPVNRIILKSSRQQLDANDSRLGVDLDGDGFLDEDLGEESMNSSNVNKEDLEEEILPPGSYYDKGGNLITPKKGGQ